MATVRLIYRSKKKRSQLTLRLRYSNNGNSFAIDAKIKEIVEREYWENKHFEKLSRDPINQNRQVDLNNKLQPLKNFVLERFYSANIAEVDKRWLSHILNQYYKPVEKEIIDERAVYWIDYMIKTASTRPNAKGGIGLSRSRINSYKNLQKIFIKYQGSSQILIKELSKEWFEGFRKWLFESEGYSLTYVNKKISDLKTICKEAKTKVEIAPDIDLVKSPRGTAYDHDMDVIYLTFEDLSKIENVELNSAALENARKYLILSCYTGQRGKDLIDRIVAENFKKRGDHFVIRFIQKKVNKAVTIPVLPKVLEIYKNGLPYRVSIQKLNKHFKTICQKAEINEMVMGRLRDRKTGKGIKKLRPKWQYIGTHSGRRSFASNHYGELPTPIIMAVTGHKKESSFLTYLNRDNEDHIDMFMDYYAKMNLKAKKQSNLTIVKNVSNQ